MIDVIIKNHKVSPADTVNALNLGEDNFILNRINESYKATLSQCGEANHGN